MSGRLRCTWSSLQASRAFRPPIGKAAGDTAPYRSYCAGSGSAVPDLEEGGAVRGFERLEEAGDCLESVDLLAGTPWVPLATAATSSTCVQAMSDSSSDRVETAIQGACSS